MSRAAVLLAFGLLALAPARAGGEEAARDRGASSGSHPGATGGREDTQLPEASYVLIVAANQSLDAGVRPLRFADDDAVRYWELFSALRPARLSLLTVVDPETARVHPEAARAARVPWMRNLREEVEQISRAVELDQRHGRSTRFTFVYVGHGSVATDGEGYVSLQDVRLRRRDLYREIIDRVPAGAMHLVIDACKAYYLISRGPGWRDDRSERTYGTEARAFLGRSTLEANPHVGVIVSTSGDEEVHEWSAFRSGVFSHQLRSALAAAADLNGDGRVEYSEIGAFIAAANQRVSDPRARIRPFVRPPAGQLHAALFEPRLVRDGPLLELEASRQGRFALEDGRGVRYADLHKAAGAPLRLALAGGRRYFIRHGALEALLPAGRRGLVRLGSLDTEPLRAEARGAVDSTFRTELFAVPFSRSFYEGYLATTDLPSIAFDVSAEPVPGLRPHWLGLQLELAYGLAPVSLDLLTGVQHNLALGVRYRLRAPFFVSLRAEVGASSHLAGTLEYRLLRVALLGGAGLRWRLASWLDLSLQLDLGYQALVQTGQSNSDPAGAKFGTLLGLTVRPFAGLRRLGIDLRGGYYGHLATLGGRRTVSAVPEGGLGVSWDL